MSQFAIVGVHVHDPHRRYVLAIFATEKDANEYAAQRPESFDYQGRLRGSIWRYEVFKVVEDFVVNELRPVEWKPE